MAYRVRKKGTASSSRCRRTNIGTVDTAPINIHGTFYYVCAVLDGASSYVVAWSLRESMTEADAEIMLQRARENFRDAHSRIVSHNGPQFIAKDLKSNLRLLRYVTNFYGALFSATRSSHSAPSNSIRAGSGYSFHYSHTGSRASSPGPGPIWIIIHAHVMGDQIGAAVVKAAPTRRGRKS